jgi:hypothetical protein
MPYYKIDSLNVTYREYWRIASGLGILYAWIAKAKGKRLPLTVGLPSPAGVRNMIVPAESLRLDVLAAFQQMEKALAYEGLKPLHFVTTKDSLIRGAAVFAADHSENSGQLWVRTFVSLAGKPARIARQFLVAFSRLEDGRILFTSNKGPEFNAPSFVAGQRIKTGDPGELVRAHRKFIEKFRIRPGVLSYNSPAQLESWIDDYESRCFAEALAGGRYIEMTEPEVVAARAAKAAYDNASQT